MDRLYRVQSVFRNVFDEPTLHVTLDTSVSTLPDWDSVATVQIVLATEAEFGVRFTTDEVASIRSVRDILGVLEKRGN